MKCWDNKPRDDTYLMENLEKLFTYRQATGLTPPAPELPEGWRGTWLET